MGGGGVPRPSAPQRSISTTIRWSQYARWASTPATVQPAGIGCASSVSVSESTRARSRASWAWFSATYDRSVAMSRLLECALVCSDCHNPAARAV